MKKCLFFLVVIFLAVLIGVGLAKDPGYALFLYQGYSVEMPLWLALFLFLIALVIFYVVIRAIANVKLYGNYMRVWNRQRKRNYAHKMLCRGLIELTEGHWAAAEKYLYRDTLHDLEKAAAAEAAEMAVFRDLKGDTMRHSATRKFRPTQF